MPKGKKGTRLSYTAAMMDLKAWVRVLPGVRVRAWRGNLMTFEELCKLRSVSKTGVFRTAICPEIVHDLIEEAWRLRIVIQVLECTLRLWRVLKGHGEQPDGILLRQDAAAEEALGTVDGTLE